MKGLYSKTQLFLVNVALIALPCMMIVLVGAIPHEIEQVIVHSPGRWYGAFIFVIMCTTILPILVLVPILQYKGIASCDSQGMLRWKILRQVLARRAESTALLLLHFVRDDAIKLMETYQRNIDAWNSIHDTDTPTWDEQRAADALSSQAEEMKKTFWENREMVRRIWLQTIPQMAGLFDSLPAEVSAYAQMNPEELIEQAPAASQQQQQ